MNPTQTPPTQPEKPESPYALVPTDIVDYDTIAFYRRRWVVVVIFLLLTPITPLIVLSGDIYAKNADTGVIMKYPARLRRLIALLAFIFFVVGIARLLE